MGVSDVQVAAVESALAGATAAQVEAERAREVAVAATLAYHNATKKLRAASAAVVRTARNTAVTLADSGDKSGAAEVYAAARIDPPRSPRRFSAGPEPARPFDLRASVDTADGSVELRWKASQPRGVHNVLHKVHGRIAARTEKGMRRRGRGRGRFARPGRSAAPVHHTSVDSRETSNV